jgi:MerR family transcriptional regulator, light-induced transcriptional regulator
MLSLYEQFRSYLDQENKYECINIALAELSNGKIDIVTLYNEILTPALRDKYYSASSKEIGIWEEHVRTSIIRTVIECCYPHVIDERNNKYRAAIKGRVIVVCPTEELHEIGARMVSDFFTLCGFDTIFVGANTPQIEIIEAIEHIKPRYVAVSVTCYYNLVAASRTVKSIVNIRNRTGLEFTVITGGYAFKKNPQMTDKMGADLLLDTFDDIKNLL